MKVRFPPLRRAAPALAVVVCLIPLPVQAQGFKWWQNESVQQKIGLSGDQATRIEDVFQRALPDLRREKQQLDALEADLSRLVEGSGDDTAIEQQVDRVESARAELNKTRTLMLLRIRRLLTADQRGKLDAVHRERARDRGRQRPGRDNPQ